LGAVTGGLLGILGGATAAAAAPVAVAAARAVAAGGVEGLATGALVGSFWGIYNSGAGFVREATTRLADGKTAVLAAIDEDWQALDTRMAALCGT